MNQAMHGDDPSFYAIPESRDLVAQYLFLYSLSGDPQDFDSFVDNDYRRATIWAFVKNDSTTNADISREEGPGGRRRSFPPGVTVQMGGSLPQLIALNEVIVNDKFRNMAQMAGVVFVLGAIIMRSFVGGLFVVTPLFAVMLANFGIDGLAADAARYHRDDHGGNGDRHRRRLRNLPAVPFSRGAGAERQRPRRRRATRC